MKFQCTVTVALKEGIFDPQGEAVRSSLIHMGFGEIEKVRIGKDIVLTLTAKDENEAAAKVEDMAKRLLANPVTEVFQYTLQRIGADSQ
jgi:phosphoribosylformylglycinamidine synthase PurS subunit